MKYKVGDTVIVHKPSEIIRGEPGWLCAMDKYDGKTFKISHVSESGKIVQFKKVPWYFSIRWIEPFHEEKEEYFDTEDLEGLWNLK